MHVALERRVYQCARYARRSSSHFLPLTATAAANMHSAASSQLQGFLQRVQECNVGLEELPTLTPLTINGRTFGQFKPLFVDQLSRFPNTFHVHGRGPSGSVTLDPSLDTPEKRSKAVAGVLQELRQEGVITGWRDELYPVTSSFYEQPVMLIERAAATHFGVKAYGIHINGYVETADRGVCLWVARRSKTKPNWPNKLDHIVAGGQPHGLSVMDNVVKECEEEASISAQVARTAKPVGCVSYMTVSATGLKPDVLFVFDIKLPESFVPVPQDGEVESFTLMSVAEVSRLVSETTEFKTNCNLVIIDFLLRHGFVSPDQAGYLDLVRSMRQGDCS